MKKKIMSCVVRCRVLSMYARHGRRRESVTSFHPRSNLRCHSRNIMTVMAIERAMRGDVTMRYSMHEVCTIHLSLSLTPMVPQRSSHRTAVWLAT